MGVFDDILKSVKKGAGAVASRTREAADRGRIWLDVNSLRNERKELLVKLGEQVLTLHQAGKSLDESLEPLLAAIQRVQGEIAVKEEEARRVGADQEAGPPESKPAPVAAESLDSPQDQGAGPGRS